MYYSIITALPKIINILIVCKTQKSIFLKKKVTSEQFKKTYIIVKI